jgi:hypothetical protein
MNRHDTDYTPKGLCPKCWAKRVAAPINGFTCSHSPNYNFRHGPVQVDPLTGEIKSPANLVPGQSQFMERIPEKR